MRTTILINTFHPQQVQEILLRERIPYQVQYRSSTKQARSQQLKKDFALAAQDPEEQQDLQDWSALETANWDG